MTKQQIDRKIDWLGQYLRAQRRLCLAENELQEARAAALHMGPKLDGMPRASQPGNKTARAAERLARAESALTAAKTECHLARRNVEQAIAVLRCTGDDTQPEILRRRYLLGQTLGQISEAMGIEYRWLRRLHRRAVERLCRGPV